MKLYIKTKTYVNVNNKWFCQKMLYAMPKVPINKLKENANKQEPNVVAKLPLLLKLLNTYSTLIRQMQSEHVDV